MAQSTIDINLSVTHVAGYMEIQVTTTYTYITIYHGYDMHHKIVIILQHICSQLIAPWFPF